MWHIYRSPTVSAKAIKIPPPEVPPAESQHFVLGKATISATSYFVETNSRMILKYIDRKSVV